MIEFARARAVRRASPPAAALPPVALAMAALLLSACGGGGDAPTQPAAAVTTGRLVITASGLLPSLTATYSVTASDGTTRTVSANDTLRNLPLGATRVQPAQPSAAGVGRFVPFNESYDVTIQAGATASLSVQYAAAAIILNTTATGLPNGATASVSYISPDGTVFPATAGAPFLTSTAGAWRVQGQSLTASNFRFVPSGEATVRTVLPGDTALFTVPFTVTSGAITVSASGLAEGVTPVFTATRGTASFTRQGPGAFPDLSPGVWQVSTSAFSANATRYTPATPTQSVTVAVGELAAANVAFTGTPILANFEVSSAYLTQAIQTPDGATPLVAGREALLRVFLSASLANDWRPNVRVTLFQNTTELGTLDATSDALSVPLSVNEGNLAQSWNVRVPANLMVPGLRMLVRADPERTITADDDIGDNVWPRSGQPQPIQVIAVGTWRVVLVPVVSLPTNVPGNVTEANKESFLSLARRLLPVADVSVRVRAPFTVGGAPLQSTNGNDAWSNVLQELNATRAIEGAPGEYWYGVLNVAHTGGIAGLGYVPGRAAIGWDYLPSGDGVAAHEWGHNLSRRHAPCGGVTGADPQYPHAGGTIGSHGWNSATNTIVFPGATDLMGYCGNQWISAFNWTSMLAYRSSVNNAITLPSRVAEAAMGTDRLLVYGGVRNGRVEVQPAFLVPGAGASPDADQVGDMMLRVEALDAEGRVLASALTAAQEIDHTDGDQRAFAASLPITPAQHAQLASVRVQDVRSPLRTGRRARSARAIAETARASAGATAGARAGQQSGAPALRASRAARGRVQLDWDAERYPRALVRDAASGRILGFLHAPGEAVAGATGALEVILSDGARSTVERITP